jgi:putative phosphoribosyl transferase
MEVAVPVGDVVLYGELVLPERVVGIVLFAHGSGSSRQSPRNRRVAATLNEAGIGTLPSLPNSRRPLSSL